MRVVNCLFLYIILLFILSACAEEKQRPIVDDGAIVTPPEILSPPTSTQRKASITGTITPSLLSAIDSDVNNPDAPFQPNDRTTTAQSIPNPVLLGGYLNLPGRGPSVTDNNGVARIGRSHEVGDVVDIYRVNLVAKQTITLTLAENSTRNDLRLRLIDKDQRPINLGFSNAQTDTIIVDIGDIVGAYYLEVAICGSNGIGADCGVLPADYLGFTNYNLSIGQSTQQKLPMGYVDMNSDFVPGDMIVKFKSTFLPAAKGDINALASIANNLGLRIKAGAMGRASLLSLGDTEAKQKSALAIMGFSSQTMTAAKRQQDPKRQLKLQTLLAIQALQNDPTVEYAEVNLLRTTSAVPNDTYYPLQWHYPLIGLPQAWEITIGMPPPSVRTEPIIVAVVDTGVLLNHPDLQGQLVSGYDFISDPGIALDGDGIDDNPDDPGDLSNLDNSSSFHGTHVAGTIAAKTNNDRGDGSISGIAGIAWNAKIMPIRVLGLNGGTGYDVMQGMRYAAGLPNDSKTFPTQKADIINLSLGGPVSSIAEQQAFNEVRNQGVIIVAAAGNEKTAIPSYPAAYNGVISVSAVDINKRLAPYSNFGASIDITAPGGTRLTNSGQGGIFSTLGVDSGSGAIQFDYNYYQGTSMAAPHVAGVLALMKAVNPALTPDDIDRKIAAAEITDDIGTTPNKPNSFGYGLINALKAVQSAALDITAPPSDALLIATPSQLNFAESNTELKFTLANATRGILLANPPTIATGGDAWLSIKPAANVSNGLGSYTAVLNRAKLAFGIYSTTIVINSNTNTVRIPVVVQVVDPLAASKANAGYIYAWLMEKGLASSRRIDKVIPTFSKGLYQYRFDNVVPGNYEIIVGNDSDYDSNVCQQAESCGAFGNLAQPSIITVNGEDKSDINISVGFRQGIISQTIRSATRPGPERPINAVPRTTN